jgi:5-methylcytosine-specific restriction endonuclease McrA
MTKSEKYADSLWSKAIKTILPQCTFCYSKESLEAAHIIPRGKSKQTRWDIENGMTLCKRCHWHYDRVLDKTGREEIVTQYFGSEKWHKLWDKAQPIVWVDIDYIISDLRQFLG